MLTSKKCKTILKVGALRSLVKIDSLFRMALVFLRSDHGKEVKYHFKMFEKGCFVYLAIDFELKEVQEKIPTFVKFN